MRKLKKSWNNLIVKMVNPIKLGAKFAGKASNALILRHNAKHNKLVKPRFLNFPVTYRCNAKCKMCGIWKRTAQDIKKGKKELTFEEIKDFLINNKKFLSELQTIGITGGEPFVRKDIVDIIKVMRETLPNTVIGIQTNGQAPMLIKEKLKQILSFYPEFQFAVSIDGPENIHDKIRGIKGAYKNAIKTIEIAKQLGIKRITTGMTISPNNYDQIEAAFQISKQLGTEFSCFLADKGDYFDNVAENISYDLTEEQKAIVIKSLKKFKYHYYMDNLRLMIQGKKKRTLPCYSGFTSIVIDPYGDVRPCIILPDTFGNIRDSSLKQIMHNEKAFCIKQKVRKCKSCWNQCEVSTSAIVYPFDVMWWFIRHADKTGFIKDMDNERLKRI